VYYFGEAVDLYKDGKVVGHEGSWLSGVNGARFGLLLPGSRRSARAFYQELAPKVALDRAMVVSLSESLTTPAGRFFQLPQDRGDHAARARVKEYKLYAKDVGLVRTASSC
jgi:hypothetical protein